MVEFFLGLVAVLLFALLGLNAALYIRVTLPDRERFPGGGPAANQRSVCGGERRSKGAFGVFRRRREMEQSGLCDAAVQEAMDEAAEAEARRSRAMDEGFDNLMGYTVNLGRGRSTGGGP